MPSNCQNLSMLLDVGRTCHDDGGDEPGSAVLASIVNKDGNKEQVQ